MSTILITGGTGLVGKALTKALLANGYSVIILTRQKAKQSATSNLSYAHWDLNEMVIDEQSFSQVTHIIHLAGAGVAEKRWTDKRKKEIVDSRVKSSQLIVQSIKSIPNKVETVVSASAIGWYGADPEIPNLTPFQEDNLPAEDFLGQTCMQWEESIDPVISLGIRLVKLRIGIVLAKEGGALKEFIKPLKIGVAAVLGNGKQMVSWIHINDLVNMFIEAIENKNLQGVYNAVAPHPVSNKNLTITLARARNKFYVPIYIPSFFLKIVLGEMSVEILKSSTVSCRKMEKANFEFQFPDIQSAINTLMN